MVKMEIAEPMPLKGGDEGDVLQRIRVKAASAERDRYEPWLINVYDTDGAESNLVYLFDRLDYRRTWRVCDVGGKCLRYELMPFGGLTVKPYTDRDAIMRGVCQQLKQFNAKWRDAQKLTTTDEHIYLRWLETTCSTEVRMVLNAAPYNRSWECSTIDRVADELPQWRQSIYKAVCEYYNGVFERSRFAVFYGRMAGDKNGTSMIYLFDRQSLESLHVRNFYNDTPSEYFMTPVRQLSAVAPTEAEVKRLARQVLLPQYAHELNANVVSLELVPCIASPRILHEHSIVRMYLDGLQL